MAKRPTRRRRRSGPAPVNALGWRRLPGSSRNYRNVSDPRYPIGGEISDRQMSNLVREDRVGRKMSKEAYTKAIRKRELSYADEATQLRQTNARNSRFVRSYLPDIAPKDKAVALKFYRVRYDGLSPAEKRRLARCFGAIPPTTCARRSAARRRTLAASE